MIKLCSISITNDHCLTVGVDVGSNSAFIVVFNMLIVRRPNNSQYLKQFRNCLITTDLIEFRKVIITS